MEGFRGKECEICTGCGRCAPGGGEMRVITRSFLKPERGQGGEPRPGRGAFAAADVGTTTLAMELYDSAGNRMGVFSRPNPQAFFGADVISRIQAGANPMILGQMRSQVRGALEEGLAELSRGGEAAGELWIAANTTMVYLLMGYDAGELGTAPFSASRLESQSLEIGGVPARTLPGISAFVGGDITAGILACGMHRKKEITLLIDLGTNGELALGNGEKILACGTAAGPAFEGWREKGEEGRAFGSDLLGLLARLLREGRMDETGLLADPYFERGIRAGGVRLSQERIRALQTAKAAVAAGIRVLLEEYGIAPGQVDQVYLAGGFGYFLDPEAAVATGLLPGSFLGRVRAAGNTALAGAWECGRRGEAIREAEEICALVQTRNLARCPRFSQLFIEEMYFRPEP